MNDTTADDYLKEPYTRVVTPDWETGTYTAQILEFPGCVAQGDTVVEAYELLEAVALSWIEAALDLGQQIPPAARPLGFALEVPLAHKVGRLQGY